MDKIDEFLKELTEICNKHNVVLWTDPMQEDIRLKLNGEGKKGEYNGKQYEYQYGINYDIDGQKYDCYEWIPNNVRMQMEWDNERNKDTK